MGREFNSNMAQKDPGRNCWGARAVLQVWVKMWVAEVIGWP